MELQEYLQIIKRAPGGLLGDAPVRAVIGHSGNEGTRAADRHGDNTGPTAGRVANARCVARRGAKKRSSYNAYISREQPKPATVR